MFKYSLRDPNNIMVNITEKFENWHLSLLNTKNYKYRHYRRL